MDKRSDTHENNMEKKGGVVECPTLAQNAHITEELARRGEGAEGEKHIKNHARNTPTTLPNTIKIIEERIKHNETKHKTNMNRDQCRFAENTHIPEELSMGRKKMDPDHLTPPTNSAKKR